MVAFDLARVIIDEEKQEQMIVLKERQGTRTLPIVIGIVEANAIRMALNNSKPPRPLTHDLLAELFTVLKVDLHQVLIDKVKDGTYYAKLYLRDRSGEVFIVDARPSDSIVLSVRFRAPLFVKESVLESFE